MKRGFRFRVSLKKPAVIDDALARKIVGRALTRLKRGRAFERTLRQSRTVVRPIPIYRASNYSLTELEGKVSKGRGRTPRGQRLGGIRRLRRMAGRDPNIGGELRDSLTTQINEESKRSLMVEVTLYSDYLGYLFRHGKSREPGTSVHFARIIQNLVYIPNKLRAIFKSIMHAMGLRKRAKKQISIKKAGLVVE